MTRTLDAVPFVSPMASRSTISGPFADGIRRILNRDPILLCGAPRTGTSWTAKVLSLAGNVRYLREPFTQGTVDAYSGRVALRYLRAEDDDPPYDDAWRSALSLRSMISKRWLMCESRSVYRNLPFWPARLLVKEVNCPLALEWLACRFRMRIVVAIRHPCGYVASGLRLRSLGHDVLSLDPMLRQPGLLRRYFAEDHHWLRRLEDPVARMAAAYGMVYKVIGDQLAHHPEWTLVHHESFCTDPKTHFRRLFGATGLRYSGRIDRHLAATTGSSDGMPYSLRRMSSSEPEKWKKELTTAQIDLVQGIIARFRLPFYREFA